MLILMKKIALILAMVSLLGCNLIAQQAKTRSEVINLAGTWKLALDPGDTGLSVSPDQWVFNDTIQMPNTLTLAGKGGPLKMEPKLDKETMRSLHQRFSYVGPAWYQREVEIPESWSGKDVVLELERVIWESRLWVNGKEAGTQDSLSAPHRFGISELLRPGKNTITLRIDNRKKLDIGIGHAYTNSTQTIWNGAVGQLTLKALPKAHLTRMTLQHGGPGTISAVAMLENSSGKEVAGALEVQVTDPDGKKLPPIKILHAVSTGTSSHAFPIELGADVQLWDEFTPALYKIEVVLKSNTGESVIQKTYGHRKIERKGRQILVNGRPTFLRGTLENAIFPKTAHPDVTGEEWEKLCATFKAHGLNHIRFHSYCPPRAAFEAADKHGMYLQIELPNWSFQMGKRPPVDEYFRADGERIIAEYGDHPSFVMFSLGNELEGDLGFMDSLVKHFRALDPDKLYTSTSFTFSPRGKKPGPADDYFITQESASGWVRGQGFLNQTPPNTVSDYRQGLSSVQIPLVSHEVGQYNNFPNLAELAKYEGGPLRSLAYEAIRDDLKKKGRLEDAPRLTRDSGKLAALLYKEDIERALRTPEQSGIQLLDIRDFPGQSTATVGILDAFGDSKGFITPEKFREFCGPVVPLARMGKFVWQNNERMAVDFELANFSQGPLKTGFRVRLLDGQQKEVADQTFAPADYPVGNGLKIGRFEWPLDKFQKATRMELVISSADGLWKNSWPVWVFPSAPVPAPAENIVVLKEAGEELSEALAVGKTVVLLPTRPVLVAPIDARFIPVFWSPLHFANQPGTLGATIDPEHPVFAGFPTDSHTNWQWWELFSTSFAMDLDALAVKPVMPLCFVDKFNRNALPAAIWEAKVGPGKLLVCTLGISENLDSRPAARQLRRSILEYVGSPAFQPGVEISPEVLNGLFKKVRFQVTASSVDPAHPADLAVDGAPATYWHSKWSYGGQDLPADLTITLGAEAALRGFKYSPRPDSNRCRIDRYRLEISRDGKEWTLALPEGSFPDDKETREITFPQPVVARHVRLVALSDHGKANAAVVAEFEPLPELSADSRKLGIIPGFNDGK